MARLASNPVSYSITKEEAVNENEFHSNFMVDSNGNCAKWRRNGATKTWKRDVNRFYLPVKHGLYDYDSITQYEAANVHPANKCPRDHTDNTCACKACNGKCRFIVHPGGKCKQCKQGLHLS